MRSLPSLVILAGVLALLPAASAGAETPTYVGAKKCRACHLKQFQTWEQTKMAKSFELQRSRTSWSPNSGSSTMR